VRSCPVKAIKVDKSFTEIIFERCIGCGNCYSNCPQNAKIIADKVGMTEELLASGRPVIAVLGCSFRLSSITSPPGSSSQD
jgi:Fe-S-cluster-containing hydrogenase component 2